VVAMVPGARVTVRVPMQSTAYAVPAGHALRLAVSPTYWPWIWPSPEPVALTVAGGALELPVRSPPPGDGWSFGPPEDAPGLTAEPRRIGPTGRTVRRDLASGAVDVAFTWKDGAEVIAESATELAERNEVHYRIGDDPLSAAVEAAVEVELARGEWRSRVAVHGTMTCDRERFLLTTTLDAYEGATRCFTRSWTHAIPRDGG